MVNAIIMVVVVTVFTRIYINKFDINGKEIISLVAGVSITAILNFIQFVLKTILDLIF